MITTGSKLFIGATVLSVVAAIVFAVTNGGPVGFMGTVGLVTTSVVFSLITGMNVFTRDGNVAAKAEGATSESAAAQPPVGASMWPLVASLSMAGLVVGVVSHPTVFKVSLVVLIAAVAEWMVQGWSERASADGRFNAAVRGRLLHPLEFPVLATVGLGAVIYAFSRIMLTASKSAGLWIFIALGAVILVVGFLFAYRRGVSRSAVAGVCALGAVAMLGVGVASAVTGQREIEEHPALTRGVCLEEVGEEEMKHADEKANTNVSAQSAVVANIELQSNGTLIAWVNGYGADSGDAARARSVLNVPRSAVTGVLFHNNFEGEHRLTARLGTFGENPEMVECTARLEEGGTAYLALVVPKSNAASSTPLELFIPTLPDERIAVVVP